MNDHDEQQMLLGLKAWSKRWGRLLICALVAVLAAAAGLSGWNIWQRRQTAQAAVLYEQLQPLLRSEQPSDTRRAARIAGDIENKFGRTPYAQMAALTTAKALYQASDLRGAKDHLQWAKEHALDREYRQLAVLRLALLLLDEKAYQAGLRLLASAPANAFSGLYEDRRGDLLAAQNKRAEARAAYRRALQLMAADNTPMRQLVQVKLDALGVLEGKSADDSRPQQNN